jgi:hypothetical protein
MAKIASWQNASFPAFMAAFLDLTADITLLQRVGYSLAIDAQS